MTDAAASPGTSNAPVRSVVAMLRVASVERSVEFYRHLGFEVGNYVPRAENCPIAWAWLYQPKAPNWKTGANLMLTVGQENVTLGSHSVLFYLYAANLVEVRNHLLAQGVKVGDIEYPEYLPEGEFKTGDPDGYTLMIAQSGKDTP